jgi:hypothetical protein
VARSLSGNETRRELPLRVDLDPPRIEVTTGHQRITYVRQGGSGSVAYRVSEATARDGVRVGTAEYRGLPAQGRRRERAHRAVRVPTDVDAKAPVRVFAEDAAGNSSEAGWA